MITDLVSKQLIVVKADTSQAKAAIKELSAVEQKAAKDRVEAQEKQNATMERNAQKFALYVAGAAAGWSLLSSGLKKYEERLVSMGSKGESELKRLRDMTGGLSQAQDNLQVAIGKVALAAAPAAKALGDMANELANIVGGVASLIDQIPGGGAIGTGLKWSRRAANPMAMAGWALGEARDRFGGSSGGVGAWFANREVDAFELVMSEAEAANGGGLSSEEQRQVEMQKWAQQARLRAARKKKPKGGGGFTLNGTDLDQGATVNYDQDMLRRNALNDFRWEGVAVPQSALDNINAAYNEAGIEDSMRRALEMADAAKQRESLLASVFGDVSEFDLYKTAWQGLEEVVSAGFSAWIDGSKSVGTAMKEALHGFAKNLAGEALLQALRHGAYALGSLAFGDMKGAAAHGISAAKWGAVAVAAGVVGKVTAPSAGGGSANANAAAGIGGGGGGRERNMSMTVVMGDQFAGDSPRYVARKVRRNLNMARMYADYESEGN